ncbi:MAG: hypothetical protein Q9165_005916 [Trypethelium subeluteriae]
MVAGHVIPDTNDGLRHAVNAHDNLSLRLCLGSHLALYLRHALEEEQGYTSTVGISTSKLLSKLVGNVNKPKGQTTLMPPYGLSMDHTNNVTAFLDPHEIGKIPNIGFRQAQKLRELILGRPAKFHAGLIYGKTQESVTVRDVRLHPDMAPAVLNKVLGGPGTPHGVGTRIWELVNGVDDTEVHQAKQIPSQISIEDSYIRLDTLEEVIKELRMLSMSLIKRMHLDLLEGEEGDADQYDAPPNQTGQMSPRRWLALPRTLRLSTRPRAAPTPDWTRSRAFNRISRSAPVPSFLFNLDESEEVLADKLVHDAWLPLFRKLHPEKSSWNLSLVNVAVTNMTDTASDNRNASGRDIGKMFKMQDKTLREWRVEDVDTTSNAAPTNSDDSAFVDGPHGVENESVRESSSNVLEGHDWEDDEDSAPVPGSTCEICGLTIPSFAMQAHQRYHLTSD